MTKITGEEAMQPRSGYAEGAAIAVASCLAIPGRVQVNAGGE
jgi:hypothetical protein